MGYSKTVKNYLASAGYNVTFVSDAAVTLDLLTTQLAGYDLIIWRTNAYDWAHTIYWYVGELSNQATLAKYGSDYASGALDNTNGILGVSVDFFNNHFSAGYLGNVKLVVLVSSLSVSIAQFFIRAGVKIAIEFTDAITLYNDMIDYFTALVFSNLASGWTVQDSVDTPVTHFRDLKLHDDLDSNYIPPISWTGDGTLTITQTQSPQTSP
jgi:hypothetical protein